MDPTPTPSDRPWNAVAWTLWAVLTAAACGLAASGDHRSVSINYRDAALHWLNSEPYYGTWGGGFLYLPAAAVLYLPFASLPEPIGEPLWRLVAIGAFAIGVRRLATIGKPDTARDPFFLMTLVAVPLSWSAARNGQATLPMAGLMMAAAADVAARRFGRSGLWLALAIAVKPLAVVMALLAAAVHPRTRLPLIAGLAAVALLPWLGKSTAYFVEQYSGFAAMLSAADELGLKPRWAQLFGMLAVGGLDVPRGVQTAVRLAAALATLGLVWHLALRGPAGRAAVAMFACAALYLVLFNPRTENNTYCLLAPAVGLVLAEAALGERRRGLTIAIGVMAAGMLGSYELGKLVTPPMQSVWLAPLMATAFAVLVIPRLLRTRTAPTVAGTGPEETVREMTRAA